MKALTRGGRKNRQLGNIGWGYSAFILQFFSSFALSLDENLYEAFFC